MACADAPRYGACGVGSELGHRDTMPIESRMIDVSLGHVEVGNVEFGVSIFNTQIMKMHTADDNVAAPIVPALEGAPQTSPAPHEDAKGLLDGDPELREVVVVRVGPQTDSRFGTREGHQKRVGERVCCVPDQIKTRRELLLEDPLPELSSAERE